jgi:hypothetical protein
VMSRIATAFGLAMTDLVFLLVERPSRLTVHVVARNTCPGGHHKSMRMPRRITRSHRAHLRGSAEADGGPGGCPPRFLSFWGGGGSVQSDAQQTRRAPGAPHFHGSHRPQPRRSNPPSLETPRGFRLGAGRYVRLANTIRPRPHPSDVLTPPARSPAHDH